jgi:hypothetical protein
MGVVGAVADDQEAEYIRTVCENDIVTSDNLLAALRYVCTQYQYYTLKHALVIKMASFSQSFSVNFLYEFYYSYFSKTSI